MTKFHEERAKIVDLLLMVNFGMCAVFYYSVFMINRQKFEKLCKIGISKRVIKTLFVNVYGKFQFSATQINVNFVVGGLKHKPGIFTIYA